MCATEMMRRWEVCEYVCGGGDAEIRGVRVGDEEREREQMRGEGWEGKEGATAIADAAAGAAVASVPPCWATKASNEVPNFVSIALLMEPVPLYPRSTHTRARNSK